MRSTLHADRKSGHIQYFRAFDTYMRPIVEYCCQIWSLTLCRDIDLIEKVQKNFTRHVFKKCHLPRMSYVERRAFIERQTLERRRFMSSLSLFYNVYHRHLTCNVLNNYVFRCNTRHLRDNSCRLFIPYCKSSSRLYIKVLFV
jgi:hypothetical protein